MRDPLELDYEIIPKIYIYIYIYIKGSRIVELTHELIIKKQRFRSHYVTLLMWTFLLFKNLDVQPPQLQQKGLTLWPSGRKPRSETTVPRSPVLSQRCGGRRGADVCQTHGSAIHKSRMRFAQSKMRGHNL